MRISIDFDLLSDLPEDTIAEIYAETKDKVEAFLNGPDDDDNTLGMARAAKILHSTSSAFADEVEKEVTDTIVHYLQLALETISLSRATLHGEPDWDVEEEYTVH